MPGIEFKSQWVKDAHLLSLPENFTGATVVISPHPDDESLGCGGTIAALTKAGKKVHIIFVSDGSMSHPNSQKYAAPLLMQLREREALAAANILGIPAMQCHFMRLKDAAVPAIATAGFEDAVTTMAEIFTNVQPQTIILPWKNDPHRDHKASWKITVEAIIKAGLKVQLLHYLVWFWERGDADDELLKSALCKIDISSVVEIKQAAIKAHASQLTKLIDDDAGGFMLSPDVLGHFTGPFELFIQLKN